MKYFVKVVLRILASAILRKYQPFVIGITGSVGKTSTKEAVLSVLKGSYSVRASEKNYNNEFGVPFTIIGGEATGSSIGSWLAVIFKAIHTVVVKQDYPQVLILEMGADRVGDISYLARLARPTIGILTALGPSHLEHFKTMAAIVAEKSQLLRSLPQTGLALLNGDDAMVATLGGKTTARTEFYGFLEHNSIRAEDFKLQSVHNSMGIYFKVAVEGSTVPVFIPGALSRTQALAALAALGVAHELKVNLLDAVQRLRLYQPPRGRLRLLNGIKNMTLVDDTYNASPQSAREALGVLHNLKASLSGKTYAVLGDMLELGSMSDNGHMDVGQATQEQSIDYLITVGTRSKHIADGARVAGMPADHIYSFQQGSEATKFLLEKVEAGSIVLIKGSQGARMEKIVQALLSEPLKATELLVRQEEHWK